MRIAFNDQTSSTEQFNHFFTAEKKGRTEQDATFATVLLAYLYGLVSV